MTLKVKDDDKDEICVVQENGQSIRSWEYHSEPERRQKILMAREFVEGWYQRGKTRRDDDPKCPDCGMLLRDPIHSVTCPATCGI